MLSKGKLGIRLAIAILCLLLLTLPAAAKVKITYATGLSGTNLEVLKARVKEFERLNPDIEVEMLQFAGFTLVKEKLFAMLATGSAPDVVHTSLNDAPELIANGALMDVTEYTRQLKASDYFFSDNYVRNGRVYGGYETHVQVHPVYWNKDLFGAAGVVSPNQYHKAGKWDWANFLDVCKKLTRVDGSGKVTQFGALIPTNWGFSLFRIAADSEIFSDDQKRVTFDTPGARQAMEYYRSLQAAHVIPLVGENIGSGDHMASSRIAMDFASSYRMNWLNTNAPSLSWDIAPTPMGPSGNKTYRTPGADGLVVAGTKHPDEAWRLVKFFLSDWNQADKAKTKLEVPVSKKALTSPAYMAAPPESMGVIAELIGRSVAPPLFLGSTPAQVAINTTLAPVYKGQTAIESAFPEAQRLAQVALEGAQRK